MKGYRTPSWFRIKGRVKERQVKAQGSKPKAPGQRRERSQTRGRRKLEVARTDGFGQVAGEEALKCAKGKATRDVSSLTS